MKRKRPSKPPKPRHIWAINPKTRVKVSARRYDRAKAKRIEKELEEGSQS